MGPYLLRTLADGVYQIKHHQVLDFSDDLWIRTSNHYVLVYLRILDWMVLRSEDWGRLAVGTGCHGYIWSARN